GDVEGGARGPQAVCELGCCAGCHVGVRNGGHDHGVDVGTGQPGLRESVGGSALRQVQYGRVSLGTHASGDASHFTNPLVGRVDGPKDVVVRDNVLAPSDAEPCDTGEFGPAANVHGGHACCSKSSLAAGMSSGVLSATAGTPLSERFASPVRTPPGAT